MTIRTLLQTPETLEALDRVGDPLRDRAEGMLDHRPRAASLLRGAWLGHPVHPLTVTIPVGSWTAAVVLESLTRDRRTARRLIVLGLVCVPVAIATGWTDWVRRDRGERRAGLVHAAGNTVATLAMLESLRQRGRGRPARGQAWSVLGLAAAGASGALGGHIAFAPSVVAPTEA